MNGIAGQTQVSARRLTRSSDFTFEYWQSADLFWYADEARRIHMTICGEMTKSQQVQFRLKRGLLCALFGGGALGFCLLLLQQRSYGSPLDQGTQIAAIAFGPAIAALLWGLTYWFDARMIVEFACDESSFRFRKLGSGHIEPRTISEIVKIEDMFGRSQLHGYRVVFRDGSEATMRIDVLPKARLLAQWLRSSSSSRE